MLVVAAAADWADWAAHWSWASWAESWAGMTLVSRPGGPGLMAVSVPTPGWAVGLGLCIAMVAASEGSAPPKRAARAALTAGSPRLPSHSSSAG